MNPLSWKSGPATAKKSSAAPSRSGTIAETPRKSPRTPSSARTDGLAIFRGHSSLATWLNRVAVNLARNRYWYFFRRRRHATLSLDCPLSHDNDATFTDLVAADSPDPAREAVTAEFTALIATCMEKLEPSHREILTLRDQLHRPYDEIAATLGLNVGTVKSRIARARENLRTLLAEVCPKFAPDAQPSSWFEPACPRGRLALASA